MEKTFNAELTLAEVKLVKALVAAQSPTLWGLPAKTVCFTDFGTTRLSIKMDNILEKDRVNDATRKLMCALDTALDLAEDDLTIEQLREVYTKVGADWHL
jgi:hypothetical protein